MIDDNDDGLGLLPPPDESAEPDPELAADPEPLPFAEVQFVENPEPRCPCVLVLDTSSAEVAGALGKVEAGLTSLLEDLRADELASKRVELAIVTYGPVRVASDFRTVDQVERPVLQPGTGAPLGEAVEVALEMVEERKDLYRANGIAHYRPWVLLVSSGGATDDWENAAELVHSGEARGSFTMRTIAVQGADTSVLDLLSEREVRHLEDLNFAELFTWLGQSLCAISRSTLGGDVDLPDPWGWAAA